MCVDINESLAMSWLLHWPPIIPSVSFLKRIWLDISTLAHRWIVASSSCSFRGVVRVAEWSRSRKCRSQFACNSTTNSSIASIRNSNVPIPERICLTSCLCCRKHGSLMLISATLCGWGRCFVADQLWLMERIREEEGLMRGDLSSASAVSVI